jgi:hypothetical protein
LGRTPLRAPAQQHTRRRRAHQTPLSTMSTFTLRRHRAEEGEFPAVVDTRQLTTAGMDPVASDAVAKQLGTAEQNPPSSASEGQSAALADAAAAAAHAGDGAPRSASSSQATTSLGESSIEQSRPEQTRADTAGGPDTTHDRSPTNEDRRRGKRG